MWQTFRSGPWFYRTIFAAIAAVIIFWRLLPTSGMVDTWPGPDLLVCLTLVWLIRRPDHLPAGFLAVVFLVEDLLLYRPPGLWTALVLVATEFLRSRSALTRELNFVFEWFLVAIVMVAMALAYRLALSVTLLPQPGLGFALIQVVWSVLAYPLVAAATAITLDLKKPAMGEVDSYGRRL
jgi:rod shape-determining protein MreD